MYKLHTSSTCRIGATNAGRARSNTRNTNNNMRYAGGTRCGTHTARVHSAHDTRRAQRKTWMHKLHTGGSSTSRTDMASSPNSARVATSDAHYNNNTMRACGTHST